MIKRVLPLMLLAGCLGGQSTQAKHESNVAKTEQHGAQPVMQPEHDWKKAATGHGAVGAIAPETLVHMEEKSAPGAAVKTEP